MDPVAKSSPFGLNETEYTGPLEYYRKQKLLRNARRLRKCTSWKYLCDNSATLKNELQEKPWEK